MTRSFDEVLEDLRALSLTARLEALWDGRSDDYRDGFRTYVEEIGVYRDTGRDFPGTNKIDGMFLRTVANNLLAALSAETKTAEWREGVNAAMWLLIGAHWRDIEPSQRAT